MKDVYMNDGIVVTYDRRSGSTMDMDTYQNLAMRTLSGASKEDPIGTMVLGLNGEAGEIADHVKKHMYHGHKLDKDALAKELGDILWYVACGCVALNVDMSDVARRNIAKLRARYPDGFQTALSINKDETKE